MASSGTIIVVSGMAFEAAIARDAKVVSIFGLNSTKLVSDIERAASDGAAGILSFGTAAGLAPQLRAGSVVIAQNVRWKQQVFAADKKWTNNLAGLLPDATVADIAGVDRALTSAQQKSQLHAQGGAVAADMESQHVAQIAQAHGLPFAALRVVLDDATCALPPAALAGITPEGEVDYAGLLRALSADPLQIYGLCRLALAQAKAKAALLRCGHLKRSLFGMDHVA